MKANVLLKEMTSNLNIDYVLYGNFEFERQGDEDVDVLIQKIDHIKVIQYLQKNLIDFHKRAYYPNQIFITGTDIKIHITDDLYIGGRRVQYLMRSFLTKQIFSDKIKWKSFYIIKFETYRDYRRIKTFFNHRKEMKLDEYPIDIVLEERDKKGHARIFINMAIRNFIFIPFRMIKKHLWVRL